MKLIEASLLVVFGSNRHLERLLIGSLEILLLLLLEYLVMML
jgi:hypothetical protein